MEGGGGAYRSKWRRSRALRSQTRAGGGGFGAENPKPSARARFRAAAVQPVLKGVAGWIQQPLLEYTKGGCRFGESWYGGKGVVTHLVPYLSHLSNPSLLPSYPLSLLSSPP